MSVSTTLKNQYIVEHCTWKPCVEMEMKGPCQWRTQEHWMKHQYPQKFGCCCQNLHRSIAAVLHSGPIDTRHPECSTLSQDQAAKLHSPIVTITLSGLTMPRGRVILFNMQDPSCEFVYPIGQSSNGSTITMPSEL